MTIFNGSVTTLTLRCALPTAISFGPAAVVKFIVGYVVLALSGQWLTVIPGQGVAIVLASGFYFAVLLSSAPQEWSRWAVTALLVELMVEISMYHAQPMQAAFNSAGHALGVLAGAHAVRICRGLPFQLTALGDVLALSFAAAIVCPAVSIVAAFIHWGLAGPTLENPGWLRFWVADAAGLLVVTPLLLTLRQYAGAWRTVPWMRWLEAAVLVVVLVAILHFIFSNQLPTVYLALPMIVWAATRFGRLGVVVIMAVFMVVIVRYSALGLGPYGVSAVGRTLLAQSFLALTSICALCLSVVIERYQAAQIALRQARDELEHRVLERTAALAESEHRLRALLDGIPERAWLKDADGRYIAVNRALAEGFGLPESKLIGKTIFDIRPAAVAEHYDAEERMARAHGAMMRFERPSNTRGSWAEITNTPIYGADGSYAGMVGIWRDISVRKQAEQQALEHSEQRYRTLVNATSQSVWMLDAEGNLAVMLKSLTGRAGDEVTGRKWLDFVHPEDRIGAATALQAAVTAGSTFEHELRVLDIKGSWRNVLARAVPVMHEDGSVREWIGTSTDISRQKTAERALRESNQTLRRLSGRREEMLEAERARIAHNLHDGAGQALNVVRMKIAALANQTSAEVPRAPLRELLGIIDQVNQDIRSLEFELSPPVLRQLGLVPALRWLGEEMQRTYGQNVSVSDDGHDKMLSQSNRAAVFRAVRELLINIAKHAKVNEAHLDAQRMDGNVVITVSDMGVGFDAANTRATAALGLGLAIVRERIEFSGGRVTFESTPGLGTVNTIVMPLSTAALSVEAV